MDPAPHAYLKQIEGRFEEIGIREPLGGFSVCPEEIISCIEKLLEKNLHLNKIIENYKKTLKRRKQ